jgi:hypothetical protein
MASFLTYFSPVCSGFSGSDAVPNPPKFPRVDPDIGAQISVVVHKLPPPLSLGYAVHSAEEKSTHQPQPGSEGMWLWFNKYLDPDKGGHIIDLENFDRKDSSTGKNKRKGGILYSASLSGEPSFEKFFRVAGRGTGRDAYSGFFREGACPFYDDAHYIMHPKHHNKRKENARDLVGWNKLLISSGVAEFG